LFINEIILTNLVYYILESTILNKKKDLYDYIKDFADNGTAYPDDFKLYGGPTSTGVMDGGMNVRRKIRRIAGPAGGIIVGSRNRIYQPK
jgi:hypothetical protein